MGVITHHGDAVEWAREYSGPLFHALLTDAPYEMGFMGKDWDASGVAFDPETWRAFARVLYPGAFLFVSAGTINDDLISVAMREAGLRKFHKVMGWVYGSGFPKASRIDANIEKRRNDEIRHVCRFLRSQMEKNGKKSKEIAAVFGVHSRMVDHWAARDSDSQPSVPTWDQWEILKKLLSFNGDMDSEVKRLNDRKGTYGEDWHKREIVGRENKPKPTFHSGKIGEVAQENEYDLTSPATPLAQAWEGHRYGLQALKPAIETILVFQKPYEGKPIDNITQTGAGALNIEGGRIGTDKISTIVNLNIQSVNYGGGSKGLKAESMSDHSGRWPANFFLDEEAARRLDEMSGELTSGKVKDGYKRGNHKDVATYGEIVPGSQLSGFGDSGGASRFFFRVEEQIDEADPVFYSAKASRGERDAGLEGMGETEVGHNRFDKCANCGGYLLQNPERPSACKCEDPVRQNNYMRNPHPTVKPLSLCKYLATLLLPPAEYAPRRLFVPFAGVGSEQIGASMAGWEEIEGVELQEDYIPINRARVEYWQKKPIGSKKPKSTVPANAKSSNQMELI